MLDYMNKVNIRNSKYKLFFMNKKRDTSPIFNWSSFNCGFALAEPTFVLHGIWNFGRY